jgi:hypothetical protein
LYASKRLGGDRVSAASVTEDMAAAGKQSGGKNGAN